MLRTANLWWGCNCYPPARFRPSAVGDFRKQKVCLADWKRPSAMFAHSPELAESYRLPNLEVLTLNVRSVQTFLCYQSFYFNPANAR
jgi:hypothetical protein